MLQIRFLLSIVLNSFYLSCLYHTSPFLYPGYWSSSTLDSRPLGPAPGKSECINSYVLMETAIHSSGVRYERVAMVTFSKVIWDQSLPQETSTQKAELIDLTQALRQGNGHNQHLYCHPVCFCFCLSPLYIISGMRPIYLSWKRDQKQGRNFCSLTAIWLPKKPCFYSLFWTPERIFLWGLRQ